MSIHANTCQHKESDIHTRSAGIYIVVYIGFVCLTVRVLGSREKARELES